MIYRYDDQLKDYGNAQVRDEPPTLEDLVTEVDALRLQQTRLLERLGRLENKAYDY